MLLDIKGRLRNINLSPDKALMPLFEAIVNSIHAIEDSAIGNGTIDIHLNRDVTLFSLMNEDELPKINGFTIVDNGVGFNEENYLSFQTSDSILKLERGSKGIGRFIWLKVFGRVSIASVFIDGDKYMKREFDFTPNEEGISNHRLNVASETELKTTVSLEDFRDRFQARCPRSIDLISKRVIEHCIEYFMLDNCPRIVVHDSLREMNLNEYFERDLKNGFKEITFELRNYTFTLKTLMFYGTQEREHTINYCANKRQVKREKLSKYIQDLPVDKKIKDLRGNNFVYFAYLTSDCLDNAVNSERTEFNLISSDRDHSIDLEEISFDEIRQMALSFVREELSPYLREVKESKEQEIKDYVYSEAPYYRPLLKYSPNIFEKIPPNLTKEKLDIELHRNMLEYEISLKEQGQQVLASLDHPNFSNYSEYQERYHRFLEQYNDLGTASLAKYVVHRKIIIDIFERSLGKDENGKYKLEKDVHRIIFPLNSTSDGIQFEMHNLWIVDEKLSYHQYLASDRQLKTIETLSIDSTERPDVVIFNNPVAFAEGDSQPYSSIVILEFKRPMRDNYSAEENPIHQVQDYIDKIRSGKFKDKNGRLVTLPETVPFYGYVICDLTAEIVSFAKNGGLTRTPDLQGFFGFNPNFNSYLEIMSFEKLVGDAKKRNQVLFKKLNLPLS
jgi:hypothetical protein